MMPSGQDDQSPTEAMPTRSGGQDRAPGGALPAGTPLGRYRIEALLGRGGMGEVYRAEQFEPVHRTVALKLLNARRLDARHLAYFEVERQLLAQMKHPAIAQVFDAGATPEGYPYFVMEYIEGSALTSFCEQRRLPLRERLELFIRICEGVQHAHQKGVIHRDLKPGNILVAEVDGRPLPKIIDFGIATAARRSLAAGESLQEFERAGTPDYMSPEQAGLEPGAEVDTRSDVYSLGVLLFELLAGHRPGAGTDTSGTIHTASTTLQPPSEQIATLAPGLAGARAAQLGVSAPQLRRLLRSELDWVVLKAMRRDRAQRYSSAAELADELRRFLDGRPLAAVPHSRRYVVGKYIARNRLAVAASAAVAVALVVGLALSLYGLQQAREQRAIAEQRSAELERVVAFQQSMLEGVDIEAMGVGLAGGLREQLGKVDPERVPALEALLARTSPADLARSLVDRNILASAQTAIDRDFADQPTLAADLRESVAEVHEALGLAAAAEAGYTRVGDYREQALGPAHPDTLRVRTLQAGVMLSNARAKEANELMEQVMQRSATLPPDGDQRLQIELRHSETIAALGDRAAARDLQQALYTRAAAARGESDPEVLGILNNLAITQARTGDLPKARAAMERLYPLRREVIGPEHEDTLASMSNLAVMRAMTGDVEDAIALQQQLVEIQARRLGAEHPLTLNQRNNLGNMLLDLGRLDEAEETMRAVLEARERVLGPDSTDSLRSRLNLSSLLVRRDRIEEGLAMESQVIEARTRILGPDHPDTLFVRINHAGTLRRAGEPQQALAEVRAVLPAARTVLGPKNPQLHAALAVQGDALGEIGDWPGAVASFREQLDLRREALGEDHPDTVLSAWSLSHALTEAGETGEAAELRARLVQPLLDAPEDALSPPQRRAVERIREEEAEAG